MSSEDDDESRSPVKRGRGAAGKKPARGKAAAATVHPSVAKLANGEASGVAVSPLASARFPVPLKKSAVSVKPASQPAGLFVTVWPQETSAENWGTTPPFWDGGGLGPHLTQSPLGEAYLHTKWHLDASSRLVNNRNGPKIGEGSAPFLGRRLGHHLTQSRLS